MQEQAAVMDCPQKGVNLTASPCADDQHQQCHMQFRQHALQAWSACVYTPILGATFVLSFMFTSSIFQASEGVAYV